RLEGAVLIPVRHDRLSARRSYTIQLARQGAGIRCVDVYRPGPCRRGGQDETRRNEDRRKDSHDGLLALSAAEIAAAGRLEIEVPAAHAGAWWKHADLGA